MIAQVRDNQIETALLYHSFREEGFVSDRKS
jgi:hypothetical protein